MGQAIDVLLGDIFGAIVGGIEPGLATHKGFIHNQTGGIAIDANGAEVDDFANVGGLGGGHHVGCAVHVDPMHPHPIDDAQLHIGGGVEHPSGSRHPLIQRRAIAHVPGDNLHGHACQAVAIAPRPHQTNHLHPLRHQGPHQMRSRKPVRPRDKCFHRVLCLALKLDWPQQVLTGLVNFPACD